jgi:hypothetical protein
VTANVNANANGRSNRSSTVARPKQQSQKQTQKRSRRPWPKQKRRSSRQHDELHSILHAPHPKSSLQTAQLAQDYLDDWIQQATETQQQQQLSRNSTQNNINISVNTTLEQTQTQKTITHGAIKVLLQPPDTFAVNLCLGAWSNCDSWEGATRAHALLNKCLESSSSSSLSSLANNYPSVDWVSFSACIHAYAKSNSRRRGAEAAERIIRHQLLPHHVSVDSKKHNETSTSQIMSIGGDLLACIHAGMDAWTKSGTPDAGRRVEGLLEFLTTNLASIPPTLGTYNAVILAWAKQPPQLQPHNY